MKARTHTEVYRPFDGSLAKRPLRAATLAWSGVRVGFRKKLPALLLFAFPAISTIVTAFVIQVKFDVEKGALEGMVGQVQSRAIGMAISDRLGEVEALIVGMIQRIRFFVILVMGWYGAGLIAEDRRLRAHLLYFARPITRWTYLRAKFGTLCFWGAMTVVVPAIVLAGQAVFQSPDYAFLTERWPTILKLIGYAVLYVVFHAALILAVSSVCDKRNSALAGVFGLYMLSFLAGESMSMLFDGQGWRLVSIPRNFERIAEALFDIQGGDVDWSLEATVWVLGGMALASLLVLARQMKRLEVTG